MFIASMIYFFATDAALSRIVLSAVVLGLTGQYSLDARVTPDVLHVAARDRGRGPVMSVVFEDRELQGGLRVPDQ